MSNRRIIYTPTNFIRWRDNIVTFTQMALTLVGQVRLLIDQATGTGTLNDYPVNGDIFWPSQQLYDATNEVLVDFWPALAQQSTPLAMTSASFAVDTSTDLYTFSTDTIMIPKYIVLSNTSMNQEYWITDVTKLEQWSNNWRQNLPAQPKWFVLWDAFHIRCFPIPDQDYTFTLFGVPWPTEISTGTEDISCDALFKLAIAYKAAANILEYTRPDIADSYLSESEELMHEYRTHLRNEQTNNMRRMKPGVGSRGTDIVMAATKGAIKIGRRLS